MDLFEETEMSVKDWIITWILILIPVVGVIFLVLWAFSDVSYRRTRKNWAIATLIMMVIVTALYLIIGTIILVTTGYQLKFTNT